VTALDTAYQRRRAQLAASVNRHAAAVFATDTSQQVKVPQLTVIVETGQRHTANLVAAYMTAKALAVGVRFQASVDPAAFTVTAFRGLAATKVYSRPFAAVQVALNNGLDQPQALQVGQNALAKLAATDLQLAQTHAARDWLTQAAEAPTGELRIVGYRRVLTGPGPHCTLCELASTRTYRVADLMAIHEHCTCTVEPLWGTEPVTAVGTTVRVENDPELGPRLMAESWSPVGPTLTL